MNEEHTFSRGVDSHTLREQMTDDEWSQLRDDVEFGRITWPIGFELIVVRETIQQDH